MELVELLGYFSTLLIGVSLGLIGGGGSILAVPVLAYLFSFDARTATAYSLFIVGASALMGGWYQHKKTVVDWRTAFVFGVPAVIGVAAVRHYVIPIIPEVLFVVNGVPVTGRMVIFGLFALLMVPAALSMLKSKTAVKSAAVKQGYRYPLILAEGIFVGAISGLVGAGGGFLIIPALVLLAKIDIKVAIGTSLIVIAFKSLLGFLLGDALTMDVDWGFLGTLTFLAIVGIYLGSFISRFLDGAALKKGFGYFMLCMACFMGYMEFVVAVRP